MSRRMRLENWRLSEQSSDEDGMPRLMPRRYVNEKEAEKVYYECFV
jgi:hypothetical protein